MTTCATCGRQLRGESRFCPGCGTAVTTRIAPSPPAPAHGPRPDVQGPARSGRGTTVLLAAVAAVAVIALGVGAGLMLRPLVAQTVGGTGTAGDSPAAAAGPAPVEEAPPAAAPSSADGPHEALSTRAAADRPIVESLVGYWVPQISSKAPGLVVGGVTYDDSRILAEFRVTLGAHADAVLLRSDDYTSFRRAGFWVVVVAKPHATAGEANAWCDKNGFPPVDCFAKRLSHIEGPQGNTVPRN